MNEPSSHRPTWEDRQEAARILNDGDPGHDLEGHPTVPDDAAAEEAAYLEQLRMAEDYARYVEQRALEEAEESKEVDVESDPWTLGDQWEADHDV